MNKWSASGRDTSARFPSNKKKMEMDSEVWREEWGRGVHIDDAGFLVVVPLENDVQFPNHKTWDRCRTSSVAQFYDAAQNRIVSRPTFLLPIFNVSGDGSPAPAAATQILLFLRMVIQVCPLFKIEFAPPPSCETLLLIPTEIACYLKTLMGHRPDLATVWKLIPSLESTEPLLDPLGFAAQFVTDPGFRKSRTYCCVSQSSFGRTIKNA